MSLGLCDLNRIPDHLLLLLAHRRDFALDQHLVLVGLCNRGIHFVNRAAANGALQLEAVATAACHKRGDLIAFFDREVAIGVLKFLAGDAAILTATQVHENGILANHDNFPRDLVATLDIHIDIAAFLEEFAEVAGIVRHFDCSVKKLERKNGNKNA